ncbi:MAG: amidase [Armatimonadetes bacterium]|nr:amidase [Armatimonadota bacterium]
MGFDAGISRKHFLTGSLVAAFAPFQVLAQNADRATYTIDDIKGAEKLAGITLTDDQRKVVLRTLAGSREGLDKIRKAGLSNDVAPAFNFVPQGKKPKAGYRSDIRTTKPKSETRPSSDEDLAFMTVVELGNLIRNKKLKSTELTEVYLTRLKRYGPLLHNVITLTEDLARQQAIDADAEIAKGKYRGPLHGIPYGLKDLFAAKEYPTTWGAEPYRNQILTYNSAVVEKLTAAGAILVAKTSLGALAYGDIWFGGQTLNPWNPKQGSSGSSAGSAAGTAAGLFAFSIGTETLGSVISPSQRCRVTGLRPTFGRTSRWGAMALSWTMDKVGTLCRTAEDCALVLAAIHGADHRDPMSVDYPFSYRPSADFRRLKIGIVTSEGFDSDDVSKEIGVAGEILRGFGAKLSPVKFSPPTDGVSEVLSIEAAAAFDEITRDGRVDSMKGSLWPPIFRASSMLSGVDYIQAMRARTKLMQRFEEEFGDFDLVIGPERAGDVLVTTNLTGHPQLFVPMGLDNQGRPTGISLIGRLYDEGTILSVANMIQQSTSVYRKRPDLSILTS